MKQVLIRFVLPVLGILVFNTVGMTGHASMSSSHGSHGAAQASQSLSCASLCMNLPAGRESEKEQLVDDKDEDELKTPFYLSLLEPISDSVVHEGRTYLATKFDPPPEPPGYILHGVFRV